MLNMPVICVTVYGCYPADSWLGANRCAGHVPGELMSLLTYCNEFLMSLDDGGDDLL